MSIHTTDFMRPLSTEGKVVQRKMCEQLKQKRVVPTHIFHSPLKRAEETAVIIGDFFHVAPQPLEALGNDFDDVSIYATLNALSHNTTVFLVGHGPTISGLANALATQPCLQQEIPKSGACILRCILPIKPGNALFTELIYTS